MTPKEKLELISSVASVLKNKCSQIAILAETGLSLMNRAETNQISMNAEQKQALIESYLVLKQSLITKFQELP